MSGMNAKNGEELDGLDHLRQSISDILTTPLGSRVMRRDYGSQLYELIDAPGNPVTMVDIYAATADALEKWEPRFKLEQVQVTGLNEQGRTTISVSGQYLPDGRQIRMEGLSL